MLWSVGIGLDETLRAEQPSSSPSVNRTIRSLRSAGAGLERAKCLEDCGDRRRVVARAGAARHRVVVRDHHARRRWVACRESSRRCCSRRPTYPAQMDCAARQWRSALRDSRRVRAIGRRDTRARDRFRLSRAGAASSRSRARRASRAPRRIPSRAHSHRRRLEARCFGSRGTRPESATQT